MILRHTQPYLNFKKLTGNSIFLMNTTNLALSLFPQTDSTAIKIQKDKLGISWNLNREGIGNSKSFSDAILNESNRALKNVRQMTFISLITLLDGYILDIAAESELYIQDVAVKSNMQRANKDSSIVTRLNAYYNYVGYDNSIYTRFIELLNHWRNMLIHVKKSNKYAPEYKNYLISNADFFSKEHAGLSISRLFENMEKCYSNEISVPTSKELLSFLSVVLKVITEIDANLTEKINTTSGHLFEMAINWLDRDKDFLLSLNDLKMERQATKIKKYLASVYYIKSDDEDVNEILSHYKLS